MTGPRRGQPDCPQLAPRPGWHGPCHEGHSRCMKAARRREAKQRRKAEAA